MAEKKDRRSVVEAVTDELGALARFDGEIPGSAVAATALALARELDSGSNSATSKSLCSKALMEALDRLAARAEAHGGEEDRVDELASRRRARRGAAAEG